VAPQANGDLRLFPTAAGSSLASALNFRTGVTRASDTIVSLDVSWSFSIQCDMAADASTSVLLDVSGYFR
jgi:hypothetical protein